jgi:hypothetical protein
MRFLMKARATLSLVLLAACVLSGCGSSPAATSRSPTPAVSAESIRPGCELVPGSLVTEKLGITVGDPTAHSTILVTSCLYAIGSNPNGVVIRFQIDDDHALFVDGKSDFPSTSDVSGVGDEAYSAVLASYTTLIARKGTIEIEITSKAALATEKGLMLDLLAKV